MAVLFPERLSTVEDDTYHAYSHMVACGKQGASPGELYYPNGVAIDPTTNHIYVTEAGIINFARISIYSDTGDFLNDYTHEDMDYIYGIARHDDNLYVTDIALDSVFKIKIGIELRLVARRGGRGSDLGQFHDPRQLTTSPNGDLYVTDCENHRIQILGSSLNPIKEISHPSMHYPCDVKLTTNEVYVLNREDSPCVHVFSHTGHKIRSLITRGEGLQVLCAFFFCLDPRKNLVISDVHEKEIKIFSNEGNLLPKLGEDGLFPAGIALVSNLKLAIVSGDGNYGLRIYSPT